MKKIIISLMILSLLNIQEVQSFKSPVAFVKRVFNEFKQERVLRAVRKKFMNSTEKRMIDALKEAKESYRQALQSSDSEKKRDAIDQAVFMVELLKKQIKWNENSKKYNNSSLSFFDFVAQEVEKEVQDAEKEVITKNIRLDKFEGVWRGLYAKAAKGQISKKILSETFQNELKSFIDGEQIRLVDEKNTTTEEFKKDAKAALEEIQNRLEVFAIVEAQKSNRF